jgi:hypothetical protein
VGRLKLVSLSFGVAAVMLLCVNPAQMAMASNWSATIAPGSAAESGSGSAPPAPSTVTAACTSPLAPTITVTWSAVSNASTYDVYQSTTSSSAGYSLAQGGVSATSWTTGSLAVGIYWFEVSASVGANWAGPDSTATDQRVIALDPPCT